ncbi:response regulator receiver domain protein [Marvinbryantia formatexigens DSM 14469]|uniref:Stage 0 sporulation protein A homolog n=1 Tax=Marvinbryantia formatexigens DSM 14469 TaxID=478749 RepID=C6LB94_9FIRM|nr:response regulator transcription factor [Marvinbryantia formatexigens]EET62225.1 response regulator receiver domain protein [Marvinbryantia formatexigens DSM 14469]UWO26447.1 response regulator transcription factor [Marvinbryantia formatexigens DSM 14469]SDF80491.1 Transcriptional regulatory protein, C terminal [Marvinbryantia formatexigens]
MYTIAVIDDDMYIGDMLQRLLEEAGYGVLRAYSGTEALMLLERRRPDLILLDLMLPGISGEEVLAKTQGIPVIVVSAKNGIQEKVSVLLDGAADYLTKPFDVRELLARIAVQLRKREQGVDGQPGCGANQNAGGQPGCGAYQSAGGQSGHGAYQSADGQPGRRAYQSAGGQSGCSAHLACGNLALDCDLREARVGEQAVRLTRTEYAILKLLMANPGRVLTKSAMLDCISADTPDCTESSLKVHVSNLRRKLMQAGGKDYIESVWGIGFKLQE